ncbi:MAG: Glu/Leu/Phe/Val dehydrogenase dimerization domain-containing protein [Gammaproteobacteria bacterium]
MAMMASTAGRGMATQPVDVFSQAESLGLEELHLFCDPRSGARAAIAIHSTRLGPALGGCRFLAYPSTEAAIQDAMCLARAMSYKAAMAGLSYGGGKAVMIRAQHLSDRRAYLEAFASFVQRLGGRYITAEDSGTHVSDMDTIARITPYVVGTSKDTGDPAPSTAFSVRRGIEAAVKFWLRREGLEGVRVAIQGTGNVGCYLAGALADLGANLIVTDLSKTVVERVAQRFNAEIVNPDAIWDVDCDVLAPCALGGVIDFHTARRIKARIVAGSANNQLSEPDVAKILQERGILYAPDFVINAGGLIQLAVKNADERRDKLLGIYDTLMAIFRHTGSDNQTPVAIAERMAETILYAHSEGKHSVVAV